MLGLAPAAPYPAKEPLPASGGVWVLGDLHDGLTNYVARHRIMKHDLARIADPNVLVTVGDMTNGSSTLSPAAGGAD